MATRTFRGKALEVFKFSVYLAMPIVTVYAISQPEFLRRAIEVNRYIVFPPEGPRPPSGTQAEVIEGLKKLNPSPQTMELVEEILAEQKMRREERERVKQLTAAAQAGASVVACNDAGAADASANAPKQTWTQWIMGYPATK